TFPVLTVVVIEIVARFNPVDPIGVVAIPGDRFANSLVKRYLGLPGKLSLGLGGVDGIAQVVAWSILDVLNQRLGTIEQVEQEASQVNIHDLLSSAEIVHFARLASPQRGINPAAMIQHMDPIANVLTRAVDG